MDLALNNLQRLICHKTHTNNQQTKNTEKRHKDLRKLTITQTPVEDHALTLIKKSLKGLTMIIMTTALSRSDTILRKVLGT